MTMLLYVNAHALPDTVELLTGVEDASQLIIIIITSTIYNWRRNTAMPLQGRLTVN